MRVSACPDVRPESGCRIASPTRIASLQGLGRRHPVADRSAPESWRAVRMARAGGARADAAERLPAVGGPQECRRRGIPTLRNLDLLQARHAARHPLLAANRVA